MAKYHIKKDGTPGVCTAQEGKCPLGGSNEHFDSAEEVQAYADKINEKEHRLSNFNFAQKKKLLENGASNIALDILIKDDNIEIRKCVLERRRDKDLDLLVNSDNYEDRVLVAKFGKDWHVDKLAKDPVKDVRIEVAKRRLENNLDQLRNHSAHTVRKAVIENGRDEDIKHLLNDENEEVREYAILKKAEKIQKYKERIENLDVQETIELANLRGAYDGVGCDVYTKEDFKNLYFSEITDDEFDILLRAEDEDELYNRNGYVVDKEYLVNELNSSDWLLSDLENSEDFINHINSMGYEIDINDSVEEKEEKIKEFINENIDKKEDVYSLSAYSDHAYDIANYFTTPNEILENCDYHEAKLIYNNLEVGGGDYIVHELGTYHSKAIYEDYMDEWADEYKEEWKEDIAEFIFDNEHEEFSEYKE